MFKTSSWPHANLALTHLMSAWGHNEVSCKLVGLWDGPLFIRILSQQHNSRRWCFIFIYFFKMHFRSWRSKRDSTILWHNEPLDEYFILILIYISIFRRNNRWIHPKRRVASEAVTSWAKPNGTNYCHPMMTLKKRTMGSMT